MHLLILGYSSIVQRRVLPAARTVAAIDRVSIASRSHRPTTNDPDSPPGVRWFDDYERALATSGADMVYVSGVNAAHERWITSALEQELHVAVDKPALLDLQSARRAVTLARRRRRCIAEATVFAFHPQAEALSSLLREEGSGAARVTATLSIPPLPAGNFRYRLECGGGSLYDLGPYVAATNRLVFGAAPAVVACAILSTAGTPAVDTSFSVLLGHEDGGALVGHFGFTTVYQNRLTVLTGARAIDVERIFTTPPDLAGTLRVREDEGERVVTVEAGDSFARFLQAFAAAIAHADFEPFAAALLDDAALVERLRQAAGAR